MKKLNSTHKHACLLICAITLLGLTACNGDSSPFNEERINYTDVEVTIDSPFNGRHTRGLQDIQTIYLMNNDFERTTLNVKSVEDSQEGVFSGSIPAQATYIMTPLVSDSPNEFPTFEMDFCNRIQTFKPDMNYGVYSMSKNTAYMTGTVTPPKHKKYGSTLVLKQETTELVLDVAFHGQYRGIVHAVSFSSSDGEEIFTLKKNILPALSKDSLTSATITQFVEGIPHTLRYFECPINIPPFRLKDNELIATVYTVEDDKLFAYSETLCHSIIREFDAGRNFTYTLGLSPDEESKGKMVYTGSYESSSKCLQKWTGPQQVIDLSHDSTFKLNYINNYAFRKNTNLRSIILPDCVNHMDEGVFANCTNLKRASIPGSIPAIPHECFGGCTKLQDVNLEDGLIEIGLNAFSHSGLSTITIPSTVTSIRDYAFGTCPNLTTVVVQANIPPTLGTGVFDSTVTTVRVPAASIAAYQIADGWKEMNILALE